MLKSKLLSLLLLFFLLFNIMHDLVLAHEFKGNAQLSVEQISALDKQDNGCNKMLYLHDMFHFTAILPTFLDPHQVYTAYLKVNFTAQTPLNLLHKNNFRPPIA